MLGSGTNSHAARQWSRTVAAITVTCLLFACGGGSGSGNSGGTGETAPSETPSSELHIDEARDHVVARYTIANLERNPDVRNVREILVEDGWEDSGFVTQVLGQLKANNRGLRRVMLHTPFGREVPIQFDAYLEALELDVLDKVTGTFVDAWRNNVTDPSLGLNIEVIGYIGSPRNDPDSQRVLEEDGEAAFFRRAYSAVAPLLQANMSIALDGGSAAAKDSMTYQFAEALRDDGVRVYTEANPPTTNTWWFNYPVIVLDETWRERRNDSAFSSHEQLQGEVIRIVRLENGWLEGHSSSDWPEAVCQILADGDTVAVPGRLLLDPERSLEDLVACANRLRGH